MRSLAAALVLVGVLAVAAWAQVYHWVDDEGVIHYTTGIESVPERYRSSARAMASSPVEAPADRPSTSGVSTTIPFTPGAPILVSARINGAGPVALILDTGAERTLVAPAALARLGITPPGTRDATIQGVTGATRADVVSIQSLEVGSARAGPLAIIAHDAELAGADGLLGQDFLSLFSLTIDAAARLVTLQAH